MLSFIAQLFALIVVGGATFFGIETALKLMVRLASKLESGSRHSDQFEAMEGDASKAAFWLALVATMSLAAILFK